MDEELSTTQDNHNPYDPYAIAAKKLLPGHLAASTVGHLPREISRITHFLMFYGANVTTKVVDPHHRRSPLVQGGLEIPVLIIVNMDYSPQNQAALTKYEELVKRSYQEPVNGEFEDVTATILEEIDNSSDEDVDT